MPTYTEFAVRYSTIQEVFKLPPDEAAILLAKSNAVIEHGKLEPNGVAEMERVTLWAVQGLQKTVRRSVARCCPS